MSFGGKRVLALESRRGLEIAELIRRHGGEPLLAPALREAPLEQNQAVFEFAGRLFAGGFDLVVLLTGVGTRQLNRLLAARYGESALADGLRRVAIVARGPKPVAALREMGLKADVVAPEPNTWRELLQAVEGRPERRIAVQEYGRSNAALLTGLARSGATVTAVRVYQYALPEDTGPLREAVRRLAAGEIAVSLFTTAVQIEHLVRVAAEEGLEGAALDGLRKTLVCSIGPTTTEALAEFEIRPALEPSHSRMGLLVKEAAERSSLQGGLH
ncbi:MAG: uroporphyrinogen-III synthase [Bryobacteraceae bacterium]|jgi:uroporphyrinogen-III synthase